MPYQIWIKYLAIGTATVLAACATEHDISGQYNDGSGNVTGQIQTGAAGSPDGATLTLTDSNARTCTGTITGNRGHHRSGRYVSAVYCNDGTAGTVTLIRGVGSGIVANQPVTFTYDPNFPDVRVSVDVH